ncbi:hypothetical protein [Solibacillus isronensis]|uniref:hypothetical protein n=1 Tax=Solibacillus isronensis TaxID=412383 RepID=UPI00203C4D5E|nr:hypothetical protein [Solibacillus isronensis]MCM3723963.1 hypothetical protein [Solibacillus isronensis]
MNLLNLELMTATEKVAEALVMRGLFVEVKEDVLFFSKNCAKKDVEDVKLVLNKLTIPYMTYGEDKIEILVNQMPILKMKKILTAGGRPFEINRAEYHQHWRFFANRRYGFRVNAFQLEYNMARFVKSANLAGIATHAGCNGHLKKAPRFQFAGPYMGVWFATVQRMYLNELNLNYDWEVVYEGYTGAELRAKATQNWCLHKIHQDTLRMAEVLEAHAAEIRELKSANFKRFQKNFVENFSDLEGYFILEDWMYKVVKEGDLYADEKGITTRKRRSMAV